MQGVLTSMTTFALIVAILIQSFVVLYVSRLLIISRSFLIWTPLLISMLAVLLGQALALYDPHWFESVFAITSPLVSIMMLAVMMKGLPHLRLFMGYGQELKKREATYRAMFERNPAVQMLIDPSRGQIVDANSAACRFYGYPYETLKKMNVSQINTLPPEALQKDMQQALHENKN
ncbi:MAG: PAS domain S-box protein, partial [Anaerolineae bacterium]|nr:PAS domain S-box protein [Anaerolineae bacterium]